MQNKAVLYVEDDENDVFLVQHVIGRAGLPTPLQIVTNGFDARNYLSGAGCYSDRQTYPLPSLVLLDWKLPGLSGLEVLRWVRSQAAYFTLPVVVFSSSNQESDIQSAYAAGADAYLVKPGSLERLFQIVQGVNEFLVSPAPKLCVLPGIEPKWGRVKEMPITLAQA